MNPQVFEYSVLPSVVRVNKPSVITVHPLSENVAFIPVETYAINILGVETHSANYRQFPKVHYYLIPNETGALVFTHCFKVEQKHVLNVTRPEHDRYSPYRAINSCEYKYEINISTVHKELND